MNMTSGPTCNLGCHGCACTWLQGTCSPSPLEVHSSKPFAQTAAVLIAGDLFIALKGEKFDGTAFLIAGSGIKGAVAVVV